MTEWKLNPKLKDTNVTNLKLRTQIKIKLKINVKNVTLWNQFWGLNQYW